MVWIGLGIAVISCSWESVETREFRQRPIDKSEQVKRLCILLTK